jgi:2-polyprenyl-3-methyl-5-hydroxy-6-metoxy-1,4-benzoquinol methylase
MSLAKLRGWLRAGLLALWRLVPPRPALLVLFRLQDVLERLIAERATAYGNGVNPKHRLMRYHDFFLSHIEDGETVLDIGCGIGEVARSVAERFPRSKVTAIDSDERILARARSRHTPANLSFALADGEASLPTGTWDVVILSNVLEHIDRRADFLRGILGHANPKKILVRVPLYERHWHVPFRRELGLGYFSDPTHFIEHTIEEFRAEMAQAGLDVASLETPWGEIWAVVRPKR